MDNNRMRLFFTLAALAAMPLYATNAAAADEQDGVSASRSSDDRDRDGDHDRDRDGPVLEGRYGFITHNICVRTANPSPPDMELINPNPPNDLVVPSEFATMAGVGFATFKRDGTMTIDADTPPANQLELPKVNPGDQPLTSAFVPTCAGTWAVGSDGRANINWNCTIKTPDPTLTISAGPVNWEGFVFDHGRTIELNLRGTLQTLTFKKNGTPVSKVNRLCEQRFTLHKLDEHR